MAAGYNLHHSTDNSTIRHLDHGKEITEIVAYTMAGGVSFLAVMILFLMLAVSSISSARTGEAGPQFMRTKMGVYFIFLLVCDFIQSAGSLMSIEWIMDAKVRQGSHCSAQAIFFQIGNVGSALWSLTIAAHTFVLLFLQIRISNAVATIIMGAVWALIGLLVIIGPLAIEKEAKGPFHGISGSWCWITDAYPGARIGLEYFWMFFSAFGSFVLYILVFLRLRGNIVGKGMKIRFCFSDRPESWASFKSRDSVESTVTSVAKQMLWYPVAYTFVLLPIAICRWTEFSGRRVPYAVNVVTGCLFALSGFVNVILFTSTRRVIPKRPSLPTHSKSSRDILSGTSASPFRQTFGNDSLHSVTVPPIALTPKLKPDSIPEYHIEAKAFRQSPTPNSSSPHQRNNSETSNSTSQSRFSTDTDDDKHEQDRGSNRVTSGYDLHPEPVTLRPIPKVIMTPPSPTPSRISRAAPSESTISLPDTDTAAALFGHIAHDMPALARF
ncbi:hypothetical protein FRC03_008564 [Tulasnella sp. 419]|nr:hypothetical protein FRC03_008564 [Tulasnella sp. 419]